MRLTKFGSGHQGRMPCHGRRIGRRRGSRTWVVRPPSSWLRVEGRCLMCTLFGMFGVGLLPDAVEEVCSRFGSWLLSRTLAWKGSWWRAVVVHVRLDDCERGMGRALL